MLELGLLGIVLALAALAIYRSGRRAERQATLEEIHDVQTDQLDAAAQPRLSPRAVREWMRRPPD